MSQNKTGKIVEAFRRFPMFGKEIEIILYDVEDIFAEPMFTDIRKEGLRLQKIFNLYDPESELSILNKKRKLAVSPELFHVIISAIGYCKLSGGRYDISKGKEFIDRKKGMKVIPGSCTYKDIILSKNNHVELKNADAILDLGSIAKGYIVDKLIEFAVGLGIVSIYIDARGDIRISGDHSERVEVQHPRIHEKRLSPILLENSAVATSGDYNQFDRTYDNSHIIGQGEIISASVIADTLMEADALATIFCILGKNGSEKIIKASPNIKVFMIDISLNEFTYNGFGEKNTGAGPKSPEKMQVA